MSGRRLLPAVVLVLTTAVTVLATGLPGARPVAGTPVPQCDVVRLLFDTDEEMRRVAGELRGDGRVREVVDERTKAQNHRLLTESLRAAGREVLADAGGVATTPASLRVVQASGVDAGVLARELRGERRRVNHVDVCAAPEGRREVG